MNKIVEGMSELKISLNNRNTFSSDFVINRNHFCAIQNDFDGFRLQLTSLKMLFAAFGKICFRLAELISCQLTSLAKSDLKYFIAQ